MLIFLMAYAQDRFLFVDGTCFHFMVVATLTFHHYPPSQSVIIPGRAQRGRKRGGGGRMRRGAEVECSHKGEWYGNYPSPSWKKNGGICWWRKGCKVMEGVMEGWSDKRMQVGGEGGCDGMAACWSPGQQLNSKSTLLIMTCQGCE